MVLYTFDAEGYISCLPQSVSAIERCLSSGERAGNELFLSRLSSVPALPSASSNHYEAVIILKQSGNAVEIAGIAFNLCRSFMAVSQGVRGV